MLSVRFTERSGKGYEEVMMRDGGRGYIRRVQGSICDNGINQSKVLRRESNGEKVNRDPRTGQDKRGWLSA